MQEQREEILRYLPHRPPFVMIDEIALVDEQTVRSGFTILPDNVLVEDGYFTEAGLIENLAQTAGAGTGFRSYEEGKSPTLGYIGALKDLRIFALPQVGQTLETEIIFVHQVMQALIVKGSIQSEGKVLITCELKIFLKA